MKKYSYVFSIMITVIYLVASFIFSSQSGIFPHIIGGLVTFMVTLLICKFSLEKIQTVQLNKKISFQEEIIYQGLVNHFRGWIAAGGMGYLLKDKFVFIPHVMNLPTKQLDILLSDIEIVNSYSILGIFDTGMKIRLKSGKEENFVIDKNGNLYSTLLNINK